MSKPPLRFSIGELSEATGVSRRTIRYYVQRGLIPPPLGAGRGHYYTTAHLERLRRIRSLQDDALSLDAIAARLDGAGPADVATEPPVAGPSALWLRLPVAPGLEVHLEGGRFRISPARLQRLAQAVAACCRDIVPPLEGTETGGTDHGASDD
ncbi:MAG: MerR family transcriptional regulator [Acidobacteria bacterium]|nr:MerR family transcriptional regulator [Acidobacteriota bacterium]